MSHRKTEAVEVACRLIESPSRLDSVTIETAVSALRQCRAEEQVTALYDKTLRDEPGRVDYLMELFFSFVRRQEAKMMQLTAQRLYKQTNRKMYIFWSVVGTLMQSGLPSAMLVVAERMLHKVFFETHPEIQPGAEEIELYVEVLKRQDKIEEAVIAVDALLGRPCGEPLEENEAFLIDASRVKAHSLRCATIRVDLLQTLLKSNVFERFTNPSESELAMARHQKYTQDLSSQLKAILSTHPDQWSAHEQLICHVLPLTNADEISGHDGAAEATLDLLSYIRSIQTIHGKLRGPFLAEMFLLLRWAEVTQLRDGQAPLSLPVGWVDEPRRIPHGLTIAQDCDLASLELVRLLAQFADIFQSKQCCFSDLKGYVEALAPRDAAGDIRHFQFPTRALADPDALATLMSWAAERAASVSDSIDAMVAKKDVLLPSHCHQEDGKCEGGDEEEGEGSAQLALLAIDGSDDKVENDEAPPGESVEAVAGGGSSSKPKPKKKNKKLKQKAKKEKKAVDAAQEQANQLRAQSVELLCALCKMEQLALFCDVLLVGQADIFESGRALAGCQLQAEPRRLASYRATKPLCAGGIGGEREVQPGDELLLLSSAAHRLLLKASLARPSASSSVSSGLGPATHELQHLIRLMAWARVLMEGTWASPFNYATKLELMEVLRLFSVGESALVLFSGLGVRYIQVMVCLIEQLFKKYNSITTVYIFDCSTHFTR